MTIPIAFSGSQYRRNADRAGDHPPCVICGKAITSDVKLYVRVDYNNRLHAVSADLGDNNFGCFPIGSECLRHYPAVKSLTAQLRFQMGGK